MTGVTGRHTNGTVVYGIDDEYVKSTEGILSIVKIITGLFAWVMMAALPYTQMIYTGGETGQFHAVMACKYYIFFLDGIFSGRDFFWTGIFSGRGFF